MTYRETRKATKELVNTLEGFKKRTKHITKIDADYYEGFARIDIWAPKPNGKVFNEMLGYLNNTLTLDDKTERKEFFCGYEDDLEIEVCVYHWAR